MKRFLPVFMLTGLLLGQDTTIVLENGRTLKGTIVSETDSTYRIMGESWSVTDGVYEVSNTFINISKNETDFDKLISKNETDFDKLVLKNGTTYFGEYSKIEEEIVYFKHQNAFAFQQIPVKQIQILKLKDGHFIIGGEPLSNKGNKGIFLFCSIMAVVFIVLEVENMISQFTLGKWVKNMHFDFGWGGDCVEFDGTGIKKDCP